MRSVVLLPFLAAALLLAACSSDAAQEQTTTLAVEEPSTTSSTTVVGSTTTMTEAAGPVSLCQGRLPVFEPSVRYEADCFLVPFGLEVAEEGWRLLEADVDSVTVEWKDPSIPLVKVRVALLEFRSGIDIDSALASVLESDGITVLGEPGPVDGLPGVWIDVEGDESPPPAAGCPRTGLLITNQGHLYPFTPHRDSVLGYGGYGVGACHRVRVGLAAVADQTLLVLAGTDESRNHDVAVDAVGRLLAELSFETS